MSRNLDFRELQSGDFEGLTSLYSVVYGVRFDGSYWNWKYFRNAIGKPLMFVASDERRIVGEIGTIPCRIQCGSASLSGAQACDITIHPDYQKKGTFLKLYGLWQAHHFVFPQPDPS